MKQNSPSSTPKPQSAKLTSSIERILKSFGEEFKKYLRPTAISTFDAVIMANEFEDFLLSALETIRQETIDNLFEQTKLHAKDEIENAKVEERKMIVEIIESAKVSVPDSETEEWFWKIKNTWLKETKNVLINSIRQLPHHPPKC